MAKTIQITLSDILPGQITIRDDSPLHDWSNIVIDIPYQLIQDTGRVYAKRVAAFYENLPEGGHTNWYEIPPNLAEGLRNGILAALNAIRVREELI